MKKSLLCLTFLLSVLAQTPRATAQQGEPPRRKITIEFFDRSLFDVLSMVQDQFGINFVYNERDLAGMKNISGFFHDVELGEFLNVVLDQKLGELEYRIIDNSVVIRQKTVERTPIKVSGSVIGSANGDPLAGVAIIIEGHTLGTMSDMYGNYELLVPQRNVKLRFSFLGYENVVVDLAKQLDGHAKYESRHDRWSLGTVMLKETYFDISEVVVTGMGDRMASSFTGSANKVTYEDIQSTGSTNVMQSLQILDPSLRIFDNMQLGSDPNAIPDFELRGSSSLGLSSAAQGELRGKYEYRPNQPLFILDGFETTAETIFNMNVNRIGSITVLKDASAKALYGSKASNGVIVVESRTMAQTGTVVSVNYDVSFEAPDLRSYDLANAAEKLELERESGVYTGIGEEGFVPSQYQVYLDRKRLVDAGLDTYWLSKPVRTGVQHKLSAMLEFGDRDFRTSLSLGASLADGVMKGSSRNNSSADVRTLYKNGSISFRNSMHMSYTKSTDSHYGSFSQYTKLQPYTPAYNEDGSVNRFIMDILGLGLQGSNPFYDSTLSNILENKAISLSENIELEWRTPIPNLRASVQAGISYNRYDDDRFYSAEHSRFVGVDPARKGTYDYNTGHQTTISGAATLTYGLSLKKHTLFFSGRFDMQSNKTSELLFQTEGYTSLNLTSLSQASSYKKDARPVGSKVTKRQLSGLAIINYVYDNRYSIDLNLRRDGSSVFSDKNQWTTSSSAGLMWNIHNEKFMRGWNPFGKLALRASMGTTGNQNQGNNYAVYSYSNENWYLGLPGAAVSGIENTDLLWEKKLDYNIGLDISLKDRLDLKIEYYDSYTSNMVTPITIAPSIGFRTYTENLGRIRNNGLDLQMSYNIWQHRDGSVRLRFAMITNKNKLQKLSDTMREFNRKQDEQAAEQGNTAPVMRYVDGQDMNTIWAVRSLGIDPASGREVFVNRDGRLTFLWDARDMVAAGSSNIGCNGSAGISASWKNLRFDMSVGFWTNAKTYNQTLVDMVEDADMQESNVDRRAIKGRWKKPGDEAKYDQYLRGPMTKPSTRFVQDYTRIKLQNIQLTYEFGKVPLRKLGIERLTVTASADNLWEWWSTGFERGTDYPFARNFRLALSATF